ncbi:NADP oxidoreductase [Nakamurella antarctica]|uniref:NADP oxidoreductase n=2 Tax=Nakamurella antarctica TaxID=1902245 RepID=A0A3G8ZS76_9ACTN|nr:NAD(P)-binding domain-containing protein [Nakamurella antarctica]AZI56926.1 NADP oxidoreductase [Nakamurella antarctica]
MKIGIIGAGFIGGTLTRKLRALGHEVRVSNSRAPETLAELAAESGAVATWAGEAAKGADLVIISIPQKNVPQLASDVLAGANPGVVVIETNNYYPKERDGLIAEIEDGLPESLWVSKHLGVPVYKAFNGIWWKHLRDKSKGADRPDRIALPIAGEDGPAKDIVFALISELGFEPIDGGALEESWRQQPGTPVYGKDFGRVDALEALAQAPTERPEAFRA